jgi:DNA invertase Pin-like site-specific DNA recombinase
VRVLAYVRVSSEEQADSRAGLEVQRAAIQHECERRGWEIVEVIEDAGFSAKDLKRLCTRPHSMQRTTANVSAASP